MIKTFCKGQLKESEVSTFLYWKIWRLFFVGKEMVSLSNQRQSTFHVGYFTSFKLSPLAHT